MNEPPFRVEVVPRAAHDIEHLPDKIAHACVAFTFTTLASNPYRVSKPLTRELTGLRAARRGAYRIIFRVDDTTRPIEVIRVGHRAHICRS